MTRDGRPARPATDPCHGRFLRVEAPHFCAHAEIDGDRIATGPDDVAPILAYMRGWTGRQVRDYCRRKGWRYSVHSYSALVQVP